MHHPPHLHIDNAWYIITASTLRHAPLLASDAAKAYFRDKLRELTEHYGITLRAWVLLDDHFHLLLYMQHGEELPRFIARLHGATSRYINLHDGITGRQVWHNYWDSCIRGERDMWMRFNYIHYNPVKHGYVQSMAEWPFSSYGYYLRTKGTDWLDDCWSRYPAVDLISGDNFVRPN